MKTVLSIAGSDSSGGAGIQADIKTITMHNVFAMTAITALTAQNTLGVQKIFPVPADFLCEQINSVFNDIFPNAIKIGMVSDVNLVEVIAERLKFFNAKNIVLDPVMIATSGSELTNKNAVGKLIELLFPIADLITPNIFEGEVLSGIKINSREDMFKAAKIINEKYGCNVLLKGGHSEKNSDDLLYMKDNFCWFEGEKINNLNTHGTGCTLSSSIAANLAKGQDLNLAVKNAKTYVSDCINAMLNLGLTEYDINKMIIRNRKI